MTYRGGRLDPVLEEVTRNGEARGAEIRAQRRLDDLRELLAEGHRDGTHYQALATLLAVLGDVGKPDVESDDPVEVVAAGVVAVIAASPGALISSEVTEELLEKVKAALQRLND